MGTVADTVGALTRGFTDAGFPSARLDARILVGHVLGLEPSLLFARGDVVITNADMATILAYANRHLAHEPVSRIVGEREFYGLVFKVTADTLDPRPDTETLVDAVLAHREMFAAPRILDLGTGTGCIPLAILSAWPEATALGIDIAPGAAATATENARCLGLGDRARFQVGNWTQGLEGTFDIVVSNPPYITEAEYTALDPEVRLYDPRAALTAGPDGLGAYRAILTPAAAILAPGGRVFLEIGSGQADAVTALGAAAGLRILARHPDLAGIDRCLVFAV